MIIALLVFSAFFVLPVLKEAIKKKLGEKERTNAPGNFVTLSRGVVHYRWLGAEKGDLVVCIHGLTTPSFVFEGLASHYADIGKRVLVYDHYGRGYSDRPTAKQDKTFFINQLDDQAYPFKQSCIFTFDFWHGNAWIWNFLENADNGATASYNFV